MKPDHDRVPDPILRRSVQNLVLGIMGRRLGNANVTDLALCLLAQQHRRQVVQCMVISIGRNTVQLVYIYVIGIDSAQDSSRLATIPSGVECGLLKLNGAFVLITRSSRRTDLIAFPSTASVP